MSIAVETTNRPSAAMTNVGMPIVEYCQTLVARLSLWSPGLATPIQTLGLTSCTRGEGVSTVAAQLAAAAASILGAPVVLVDGNLDAPSVHRLFDVPLVRGLREALSDPEPVCEFLKSSEVPNLSLLTAGQQGPNASWALNSRQLGQTLDELKQEFRLVIVDLPPLGNRFPATIEGQLDGLLLVVESEKVRWEVAQSMSGALADMGANLLGVVMNKRPDHVPRWLYNTL
jgi:capsular exopolysaccharide synthesis family protein